MIPRKLLHNFRTFEQSPRHQHRTLFSEAFLISSHVLGVPPVAVSGLHSSVPSGDAILREGRQNKKSKWDKVFLHPCMSGNYVSSKVLEIMMN